MSAGAAGSGQVAGGRAPREYRYQYRGHVPWRKGKFCRVVNRGPRTGWLLLEFEDGTFSVGGPNTVRLRPEFKFRNQGAGGREQA